MDSVEALVEVEVRGQDPDRRRPEAVGVVGQGRHQDLVELACAKGLNLN